MRRRSRLLLSGLVVVLAGVGGAALWLTRTPTTPPTNTSTTTPTTSTTPTTTTVQAARVLFGEVRDAEGRALNDVSVDVDGAPDAAARTNARGEFLIDPWPAAGRAVVFSAAGFRDARISVDGLFADGDESFWVQRMARAAPDTNNNNDAALRVCVVVDDDDRAPIAGAEIIGLERAALAVTGDDGCAAVDDSAADLDDVFVGHGRHGVRALPRLPRQGTVTTTLPPSAQLRGFLVDERQAPVTAAFVRLKAPFEHSRTADARTREAAILARLLRAPGGVTVDDDGAFAVVVAAGDYVLDVNADGFRPTSVDIKLRPSTKKSQLLVLEGSPTLAGVVTDGDGAPVVGATVHLDGARGPAATTDASGRFVVATLPARPTSLSVKKRGYREVTVGGVDGRDSRPDDVRVQLVRGSGKEVVGIGVGVRGVNEGLVINYVEAGSPADAAGLAVDDLIVAVDGARLGDGTNADIGKVRGLEGTSVSLRVRRDGRDFDVDVVRARVPVRN